METQRRNEITYGILVLVMSKDDNIELNPDTFKRRIGNMTNELAKVGVRATQEEIRDAAKSIFEDLVKYAFDFSFKNKKRVRAKQEKEGRVQGIILLKG